MASKVRNIAIQPTLQQCCKTSRRFLPVSRFTVAYKILSVPIRCKPLWYLRSDRCMHGNYYGMFRIVHGTLNWALTACCWIRPKGKRERANDSVHYCERDKHYYNDHLSAYLHEFLPWLFTKLEWLPLFSMRGFLSAAAGVNDLKLQNISLI